jgi:hypothetical protein
MFPSVNDRGTAYDLIATNFAKAVESPLKMSIRESWCLEVNITADKLTYFTENVGMDIDGIPRGELSLSLPLYFCSCGATHITCTGFRAKE